MNTEDKQELTKYWEDQLALMATEGWDQFTKSIKDQIKQISDVSYIKDAEQLHNVKGQLYVLQTIINRPNIARQVLDNLDNLEDQ